MCKTKNRGLLISANTSKDRVRQQPPLSPLPNLFPPPYELEFNEGSDSFKQKLTDIAKMYYMPCSIIDLTSTMPTYWGYSTSNGPEEDRISDKKKYFLGSTAKIAVLFAALWLRKTVNENANAKDIVANNGNDLLDELSAKWVAKNKEPFPDQFKEKLPSHQIPKIPSNSWLPSLKDIFEVKGNKGNWKIDFKTELGKNYNGSGRLTSLKGLSQHAEESFEKIKNLNFRDKLELMMGWSNNNAAASCINSLGYQFLQGCIKRAGFIDKKNKAGILFEGNYSIDFSQKKTGNPPKPSYYQGGTSEVISKMMALAVTNNLYDDEISKDFLLFTNRKLALDIWTNRNIDPLVNPMNTSWIMAHLSNTDNNYLTGKKVTNRHDVTMVYSKVGDGDNIINGVDIGIANEVAFIQEEKNGKILRYVVAALQIQLRDPTNLEDNGYLFRYNTNFDTFCLKLANVIAEEHIV